MQNAQNEVKELHNSIGTLDTDVFSMKDDFVKICDKITTVSGKVEEIIDNVQKLPHVAGHLVPGQWQITEPGRLKGKPGTVVRVVVLRWRGIVPAAISWPSKY